MGRPRRVSSQYEIQQMKLLIEHGADVNRRVVDNGEVTTPLMRAARQGRADLVKFLLSNKADASVTNAKGADALAFALQHNHKRCAEMLMIHGDSLGVDGSPAPSCLALAIKAKWYNIASRLITRGADLEAQDERGWTSLMHAVSSGRLQIVEMLVDRGAFLNATGKRAEEAVKNEQVESEAQERLDTALNIAVRKGFYETAKLLLDSGSSVTMALEFDADLVKHGKATGGSKLARLLARHIKKAQRSSGSLPKRQQSPDLTAELVDESSIVAQGPQPPAQPSDAVSSRLRSRTRQS